MAAELPRITEQPSAWWDVEGARFQLRVTATGSLPLNYQWFFQEERLPGETNATLQFPGALTNQSGNYRVEVANEAGVARSTNALLTIQPATPLLASVDPAFRPNIEGRLYAVAEQASGKILAGGRVTAVNGQAVGPLFRLNADGSLDASFHSPNFDIFGISITEIFLRGPHVYIRGQFTAVDGVSTPSGIARLSEDGVVDDTFVPAANEFALLSAVRLSDGRLWAGDRQVMLDSEGKPDRNFLPDYGRFAADTPWNLLATVMTPDDGLIQAVSFGFGPYGVTQLFRLKPDGRPDDFFRAEGGIFEVGFDPVLALQRDGHLLVSATSRELIFSEYMLGPAKGRVSHRGLARLLVGRRPAQPVLAYGAMVRESVPGGGATFEVEVESQSPVVYQWLFNNQPLAGATNRVLRLANLQASQAGEYRLVASNATGSVTSLPFQLSLVAPRAGRLDAAFQTGASPLRAVTALLVQPDGRIVIAGPLASSPTASPQPGVARLQSDGRVDGSFQSPSPAINQSVAGVQPTAMALRPDGRILLGGAKLAQLNADGTLDPGFSSPFGFGPPLISTLGLDRQGRILFGQVEGGFPQNWRIAADGRRWDPLVLYYLFCVDRCVGRPVTLNSILPMPDGSIYLAGQFTHLGPVFGNFHVSASVARLQPDGQEDRTFATTQFAYRNTNSFERGAVRIARAVAAPDGKLVLAVADRILRGPHVSSIVRLNPDGKIDRTFACYFRAGDFAVSDQISALAVQSDGRVLVGGQFASFLGRSRPNLARLNADGSFDDTFDAGAGPNGEVKTIAPTPGGDVLIGGSFTSVNGQACSGIARLKGEPYAFPPVLLGVRYVNGDGAIGFALPTAPGKNYFLEYRESPISGRWQVLSNFAGDDSVKIFQDVIQERPSRVYRVRVEP